MEASVIPIEEQGPDAENRRRLSINLIRRELFKVARTLTEEANR